MSAISCIIIMLTTAAVHVPSPCIAQVELSNMWNWLMVECRSSTAFCLFRCIFGKMEIIVDDQQFEDGWYQERRVVEWMRFPVDVGLIKRKDADKVAEICSRVNKIRTTACRKGEIVRQCLLDELHKILSNKDNGNEMEPGKECVITPETLKVVEENCRKITNETCVKLCIMKKLGVIDERGWYVESKGTEFINSIFPTDVIIDNQESIFQQIAQTCNRVNNHVSNNCHRGEEVANCLNEEMEKVS
ncbi:uncharacterized protein LOC134798980 [Cydia splendana]|uniref:uncharacterized protein LOC134798980 n=1 Tax=Cydia splendana TaxID=1100963 RepID=UPI00300C1721